MKTPMVPIMLQTFYPSNPVKVGCQTILYSIKALGCDISSEAMKDGIRVLDKFMQDYGKYILSGTKSVPAFNAGKTNELNKWITLYAYLIKDKLNDSIKK